MNDGDKDFPGLPEERAKQRAASGMLAERVIERIRDEINYHAEIDPGGLGPIEPSERKAGFRATGSLIHRPDRPAYMARWVLFRVGGFEVRINAFLSSDPDCQHDHPAGFISLILCGWYREITPTRERVYKAGRILFRRARWIHRIEVGGPCLTINFVWPRTRNWGFWTRKGWVPWRNYNEGQHQC